MQRLLVTLHKRGSINRADLDAVRRTAEILGVERAFKIGYSLTRIDGDMQRPRTAEESLRRAMIGEYWK